MEKNTQKNILAIYDPDEEYVMKLMNYLCEARSVPLEVQAFTDRQRFLSFIRETKADILLIDEKELDEEIDSSRYGEIMLLTESETAAGNNGHSHRAVCKYQSSDNVLREIMNFYADRSSEASRITQNSKAALIGVYSPIRRCFRTSFAVALGQIMSCGSKCLYVNLEEYSGFNSLLQRSFTMDMSDLLFYIGQKKRNFPFKLAGMVQNLGRLEFIPPAVSPADLKGVGCDMWVTFFNELLLCGYEHIVVDFGDLTDGLFDILKSCSKIYMPTRSDSVSKAKIEQFEAMARILEYEEILDKVTKLEIPFFREMNGDLERLSESKLGEHIRRNLIAKLNI